MFGKIVGKTTPEKVGDSDNTTCTVSYIKRCKFLFLWYTVNQTNRNLDLGGDLLNGNGIDKHHFHVHINCVKTLIACKLVRLQALRRNF
jgi:hypothetical protein